MYVALLLDQEIESGLSRRETGRPTHRASPGKQQVVRGSLRNMLQSRVFGSDLVEPPWQMI